MQTSTLKIRHFFAFVRLLVLACFLAFFSSTIAQAQSVEKGTCSYEKLRCDSYCKTNDPNNSRCFDACSRRLGPCLATGTYYWRTLTDTKGLKRCCGDATEATCTGFSKHCYNFCDANRTNKTKCYADCRNRTQSCKINGRYNGWPEARGLIRK